MQVMRPLGALFQVCVCLDCVDGSCRHYNRSFDRISLYSTDFNTTHFVASTTTVHILLIPPATLSDL